MPKERIISPPYQSKKVLICSFGYLWFTIDIEYTPLLLIKKKKINVNGTREVLKLVV